LLQELVIDPCERTGHVTLWYRIKNKYIVSVVKYLKILMKIININIMFLLNIFFLYVEKYV